jgi:hypothetical protein
LKVGLEEEEEEVRLEGKVALDEEVAMYEEVALEEEVGREEEVNTERWGEEEMLTGQARPVGARGVSCVRTAVA